jgi:hypothetical protein
VPAALSGIITRGEDRATRVRAASAAGLGDVLRVTMVLGVLPLALAVLAGSRRLSR